MAEVCAACGEIPNGPVCSKGKNVGYLHKLAKQRGPTKDRHNSKELKISSEEEGAKTDSYCAGLLAAGFSTLPSTSDASPSYISTAECNAIQGQLPCREFSSHRFQTRAETEIPKNTAAPEVKEKVYCRVYYGAHLLHFKMSPTCPFLQLAADVSQHLLFEGEWELVWKLSCEQTRLILPKETPAELGMPAGRQNVHHLVLRPQKVVESVSIPSVTATRGVPIPISQIVSTDESTPAPEGNECHYHSSRDDPYRTWCGTDSKHQRLELQRLQKREGELIREAAWEHERGKLLYLKSDSPPQDVPPLHFLSSNSFAKQTTNNTCVFRQPEVKGNAHPSSNLRLVGELSPEAFGLEPDEYECSLKSLRDIFSCYLSFGHALPVSETQRLIHFIIAANVGIENSITLPALDDLITQLLPTSAPLPFEEFTAVLHSIAMVMFSSEYYPLQCLLSAFRAADR
ncbi:hypothetical protein DIPPA_70048 [Diplonema papillatum]|nr:hypothetical protein DIPPA_70048 [Diplonema papillatum]